MATSKKLAQLSWVKLQFGMNGQEKLLELRVTICFGALTGFTTGGISETSSLPRPELPLLSPTASTDGLCGRAVEVLFFEKADSFRLWLSFRLFHIPA